MRYPDGTYLPALNGILNPDPVRWPEWRPYSPVIGIRDVDGVQWYEHADGSMSTTTMVPYEFLGKKGKRPATLLANPLDGSSGPPPGGLGPRAK